MTGRFNLWPPGSLKGQYEILPVQPEEAKKGRKRKKGGKGGNKKGKRGQRENGWGGKDTLTQRSTDPQVI